MARGILTRFITRIYFDDELANATIRSWGSCQPRGATRLVAHRTAEGHYAFDIVMQGPHETVFFDV
jgi:protocatechuate 3,4-dioxygenase alpha subunit